MLEKEKLIIFLTGDIDWCKVSDKILLIDQKFMIFLNCLENIAFSRVISHSERIVEHESKNLWLLWLKPRFK